MRVPQEHQGIFFLILSGSSGSIPRAQYIMLSPRKNCGRNVLRNFVEFFQNILTLIVFVPAKTTHRNHYFGEMREENTQERDCDPEWDDYMDALEFFSRDCAAFPLEVISSGRVNEGGDLICRIPRRVLDYFMWVPDDEEGSDEEEEEEEVQAAAPTVPIERLYSETNSGSSGDNA